MVLPGALRQHVWMQTIGSLFGLLALAIAALLNAGFLLLVCTQVLKRFWQKTEAYGERRHLVWASR